MFKLAIAAAVAAASFGASAQELLTFNDSWGSPKSRAEVRAELAAGPTLAAGESALYPLPATAGRTLSRAEVRASLAGWVAPHPEAGDAATHARPVVRMAQAGTVPVR